MKVVSFDLLLSKSLLPRSQPKERVGIVGRCAGDYFHLFLCTCSTNLPYFLTILDRQQGWRRRGEQGEDRGDSLQEH